MTKNQKTKPQIQSRVSSSLLCLGILALSLAACDSGNTEAELGPISGRSFDESTVTLLKDADGEIVVPPEDQVETTRSLEDTSATAAAHLAITAQEPEAEEGAPPLLSFAVLAAFPFEVVWGKEKAQLPKQIPDSVLAWDGKHVRTAGFMVPLKVSDAGHVESFYLIRDTGNCCFGGKPQLNNMIVVNVKPEIKCQYIAYQPLEIRGKIEIGEEVQFNRIVSVYRMNAEKVRYTEVD